VTQTGWQQSQRVLAVRRWTYHPLEVTKFFRGNPRLLLQALPVAFGVIVLKWLYDESSAKHLELSPLLAGVIAAEVFIVGFMLSGTAGDFKEAERLPGELAASLETVADECLTIDAELKLPEARQCVAQLVEIGHSVHRVTHDDGCLGLAKRPNTVRTLRPPPTSTEQGKVCLLAHIMEHAVCVARFHEPAL
jgi:hypothetical protein